MERTRAIINAEVAKRRKAEAAVINAEVAKRRKAEAAGDKMQIDLHGYHPSEINVPDLLRQAWETGASEVILIHGHGHNRGISVGFVNTNTGYFGLQVRQAIRRNSDLKPWVKTSTLYCGDDGSTTVKLQRNPNPTRTKMDLPERQSGYRHE